MSGQESAGRPQDPLPCRRPLPSRRPRARHHHVEAQDLLTCDTSAARCQSPLAASQRRLTMTNSLNRYSDGVTELRQGKIGTRMALSGCHQSRSSSNPTLALLWALWLQSPLLDPRLERDSFKIVVRGPLRRTPESRYEAPAKRTHCRELALDQPRRTWLAQLSREGTNSLPNCLLTWLEMPTLWALLPPVQEPPSYRLRQPSSSGARPDPGCRGFRARRRMPYERRAALPAHRAHPEFVSLT